MSLDKSCIIIINVFSTTLCFIELCKAMYFHYLFMCLVPHYGIKCEPGQQFNACYHWLSRRCFGKVAFDSNRSPHRKCYAYFCHINETVLGIDLVFQALIKLTLITLN